MDSNRYKKGKTAETFVSLADTLAGFDQDDFDLTESSETSSDILEAIAIADERLSGRVRFGSVRVQTHKVVLGDVSCCRILLPIQN